MVKPINVWIAKKYPADGYPGNVQQDQFYAATSAMIQQVTGDLGLTAGDGAYFAYQYSGDSIDKQLKVQWYQLPQLLFSTPDPHNPDAQIFLAKLVQDQINAKNFKTMLEAVRRLQPKSDPSSDEVTFYDPTLFAGASIGVSNVSGAPGKGFLIGLNPLADNLEINRGGQILDNVLKYLPWVLGGVIVYEVYKHSDQ